MYTDRHHGAGRLIVEAVAAGDLGAALTYTDVGSLKAAAEEDLDLEGTTGNWLNTLWTLAPAANDADRKAFAAHGSRPDAVVWIRPEGWTSPTAGKGCHILLLELKYCPHSHEGVQKTLKNATDQHAQLLQLLRKSGNTAEIVPVLLGVGGLVFQEHTLDPLIKQLGIKHADATALLHKLQRHAATWAHSTRCTNGHLRSHCGTAHPG
jgi:hypothetical protein